MSSSGVLTRRDVFALSWPIMIANATAPLVGLVDTFVIGRFTGTQALAGIGLGAVIYNIVFWGFGFLRMSTAGLTAQSDGAGNHADLQSHLFRAVPMGLLIGVIIFALQAFLIPLAFQIFAGTPTTEALATDYIKARLWGLPAYLGGVALLGWFIGLSRAKLAFYVQLAVNLINIALSIYFVMSLGWGIKGAAYGSVIAEWSGLILGIIFALGELKRRGGIDPHYLTPHHLLKLRDLAKLGVTNVNLFIRTLALVFGFSFFGNAAAAQGDTFLAGNHILMQFISISAFILDAFANTAEAVTGKAYGAKSKAKFDRAVRLTSEFSGLFALVCSAIIMGIGWFAVGLLTNDASVIQSARTYLPLCALVPLIGFAAFQLDGIFIGTTRSAEMRNASIAAVLIYLAAHYTFAPVFGGVGLWAALLVFYGARAAGLLFYMPRLRAGLT